MDEWGTGETKGKEGKREKTETNKEKRLRGRKRVNRSNISSNPIV